MYTVGRLNDLNIDDENFLQFEEVPKVEGDGFYSLGVVNKHNELYFRLTMIAEKKPTKNILNIFSQMLSTFKFLD